MSAYPPIQIEGNIVQNDSMVFITVKFPWQTIPEFSKVGTIVWPGDSLPKVAKEERHSFAKHYKHWYKTEADMMANKPSRPNPALFAWAVYLEADDLDPFIHSQNWK